MIESYQQEMAEQPAEVQPYSFATIGEVYEDGVTLIFPGEAAPSEKHYKVNTLGTYAAGQRVKVIKDSGTYIVEYPVGKPKQADPAITVRLTGDATGSGTANSGNIVSITTSVIQAEKVDNSGYGNSPISFSSDGSSNLRYRIGSGNWITLAKT